MAAIMLPPITEEQEQIKNHFLQIPLEDLLLDEHKNRVLFDANGNLVDTTGIEQLSVINSRGEVVRTVPYVPNSLPKIRDGQRLAVDENTVGLGYLYNQASNKLQTGNLLTLWQMWWALGLRMPPGAIIDAGGGKGVFTAAAPHFIYRDQEMGIRTIITVDRDEKSLEMARQAFPLVAAQFARDTADQRPGGLTMDYIIHDPINLANLDPMGMYVGGNKVPWPTVGAMVSNQVLHWLSREEKFKFAGHAAEIIRPGGYIMINAAAPGTAKAIQEARHLEMLRLRRYNRDFNPQGYKPYLFNPNPIGLLNQEELAEVFEDNGFEMLVKTTLTEKVVYPHPRKYADAVKDYGMGKFLDALPHYELSDKEAFWNRLVREFEAQARVIDSWEKGKPYVYPTSNIYLIGRRREKPAGTIAKP